MYVYGESYGVIWDIAVNRSNPADDLIVVGAFDTVSKLSQAQYCGVGVWTGLALNKVTPHFCHLSWDDLRLGKVYVLVVGRATLRSSSILWCWEMMAISLLEEVSNQECGMEKNLQIFTIWHTTEVTFRENILIMPPM